jgi:hypothetical protein
MKYAHTLNLNAKEIEIMNEALRMYRKHMDKRKSEKSYGNLAEQGFLSYHCKVTNMAKVMEDIKNLPKPVASERGKIPEGLDEQA